MSQSRSRKAPAVVSEAGLRARPSHTKASGDTVTPHPQRQNQRSKSKSKSSKVPKALRYDLENALVGLCNVWFEDIKPHLLRNNIKVHVHGGDAGAGDNQQEQLPPGAPGCSHLDPATTASGCELCRLLFNASNSIESAVSQAASAALPASPAKVFNSETTTNTDDNQHRYRGSTVYSSNSIESAVSQAASAALPASPLKSSALRRQPTQPYPNREGRSSVKERVRQVTSPSPPKSELIGLVPRLCHTNSIPSTVSLAKRTSNYVTRPKKNDKKKKIKKVDKATQTEHISQLRLSLIPLNVTKSQKHFHKSRATTAFYPPRRKKSRNSGQIGSKESQRCQWQDDKHIKCLYQSATKEEYPSVMNLVRSPKDRRKQVGSKTLKPWK